MSVAVKIIAVKIIVLAMDSGLTNDQRSRVGNGPWQCHPRIGSPMFVQGQRSAMFLWQCSSKVVAMFLRLDAFFS